MRSRISNPVARAFTLIEILIVVVILGILAAIVIPQFTDASQSAMEASVRTQLQTIRSQIELFRVRQPNDFALTTAATLFADLVTFNYLQQPPRNPFLSDLTEATTVGSAVGAAEGWYWTGAAGDFFATDGAGGDFIE